MSEFLGLLFWLVAAHALADGPLQPPEMSRAKRGLEPDRPWYMAIACHALIHGGGVALATGRWELGVAETVAHGLIDGGSVVGLYGLKVDQALHLATKVVWALVAVSL